MLKISPQKKKKKVFTKIQTALSQVTVPTYRQHSPPPPHILFYTLPPNRVHTYTLDWVLFSGLVVHRHS
jgi:hypothetical protein